MRCLLNRSAVRS
ncbi:hypothetical protein D046_7701A, partial [Vibrio parahaemolyticus V-223/04]